MLRILMVLCAGLWMPWALALDASLKAQLEQIQHDAGVAAMAVVTVTRDGQVESHVAGVRSWQSAVPVDESSIFRVGSISKMFTGMALLKAEAAGLLDLQRPLREYLMAGDEAGPITQWFDNPWHQQHPLTVAQLLEHSAGWHDMSGLEFDHNDPQPVSLARALQVRPVSRRSHWPPGIHSEYSNSGAGLAAYVFERASGRSFEDYVMKQVLQPLGMESASFRLDQRTRRHLVQGYGRDGKTPIPYWHILYRPAGGLNLVPRDMARVMLMLLRRGQVGQQTFFDAEQLQRLEYPQTTLAARQGLSYGYGYGIYQSQHRGHVLFGHGGDADGYLSHFQYSPTAGRGYFAVITAFNHAPLRQLRAKLNDWLVAELPSAPRVPAVQAGESQLRRLSGDYQRAAIRFARSGWRQDRLSVFVRGGRLFTRQGNGRARALIPLGKGRFRRPWESVASAVFVPLADGSIVLQGGMGNWQRLAPRSDID